jgi:hypothetical protein
VKVEPLPCADPLGIPCLERELLHTWFVWDAWVSGKRRVDLHPFVLGEREHAEARRVAEHAWALVAGAADRAAAIEEERAKYNLHPDVERLARAARLAGDVGSVARVDLLLREDGRFVACEVNADCPGGLNETLALPRLAKSAGLRFGDLFDPTNVAMKLADRLVAASGGSGSPRGAIALVYATAYAEDLQICALVERLVRERGGRTVRVAPTNLVGRDDALFVGSEQIAVLYRFYPLEWMAEQKNVAALAQATRAGLTSISSFAWIHAQSKLAMARVTDPEGIFPETREIAEVAGIENEREAWVVKRDLSRVGDHVFVGALTAADEFRDILDAIAEDPHVWIAQRYVPQRPIATPWGPRLLTLGVYLVDGLFAGYFARLSAISHCSHDALVVPVFVRRAAS